MDKPVLYIVSTPIGNMEDITLRALRVMKESSFILCEDTRQTGKLLKKYEISKQLVSLHSHSTDEAIEKSINRIITEKSAAYLTDCGTPAVSDPGSKLVNLARKKGVIVSPIPGPSALTAFMSSAGVSSKNIIFCGFISKKPGKRINELTKLKEFPGLIILYESPHRILKTVKDITTVFPDKKIVIAREMTKIYEEFIVINPAESEKSIDIITEKGEFTIGIVND